jgi:hypothetical protein
MWKKVAIIAIVILGIGNLVATRSDAMICSPGMGKPGLELRQATTTFEPIRVGRSRTTNAVRHHFKTPRQGTSTSR